MLSIRRLSAALLTPVLAAVGLTLLAPPAAQAATQVVTVQAMHDTYFTPLFPDTVYGSLQIARVDEDGRTAHFKFDVPAAPAGMEVKSAELQVKVTSGPALEVSVHTTGNTWTEDSTYNNNGATPNIFAGKQTVGAGGTLTVPVPTVTAGDKQSVRISRTAAGNPQEFGTRENTTAANRPKLVVTFETAATPTKTNLRSDQPGAVGDNGMVNIKAGDQVQFNGNYYVEDAVSGPVRIDWYIDNVFVTNAAYAVGPDYTTMPVGTYGSESPGKWTATEGAHVVKMTMDVLNAVDESNEADNVQTRSFTVAPVTPVNQPPTVNAGADATVKLPASASLDGTVTDPDSAETTAWSKVSGPGTVTFGNAAAVDTTASFSVAGSYVLRLTANDGVNPAVSDDVAITVQPADVTPPPSGLPYGAGSFFQSRVDGAGVPIDSGLTSTFQYFMAHHESQAGIDFPKVNLLTGWSGHNHVSQASDPIWKLVGTNTGVSNTRLGIVKTQGVHLADSVWETVPTGTQDRLLVIYDKVFGYTVQCADVVPNMTARTWTASNCGVFWHSSNGLDYNNPLSNDDRNYSSRGRIVDAMQVPRSELDAAVAGNRGLGRVMHIFFVETCGADGHVHPMTNEENKNCWTGESIAGVDNDGGIFAEGTRLRIKPSVDLPARGLSGAMLVLARTLQQNGGYIGDNSGSATQLKIGPPEEYVGTNLATNGFSGKLSWADFEVVQPGWQ